MFFKSKRHFLKNVVCQCPYFMGQRQINRGAINCKSGIMCFTNVRMTFWSVKVLEPHDLRRMVQQTKTGPAATAYSLCGEQNPFIFVQKQLFLRSGGIPHVLGLPTIIII